MRGSLQGVLRRVERMSVGVRYGDCGKSHSRHRLTTVWGDAPVPPWPEPETPRNCAQCGRPFTFHHIVDQLNPAMGDENTSPPSWFQPESIICIGGEWTYPGNYPGERQKLHAW